MVIDSLFQKRSQNYQSTCRQMYTPPPRSTSDDWLSDLSHESQLKCEKRPPRSSKYEMLIFGLHSTSDDRPSNPSNESRPKNDKTPPKSLKNEMLIFGLHSTSDHWLCNPATKVD